MHSGITPALSVLRSPSKAHHYRKFKSSTVFTSPQYLHPFEPGLPLFPNSTATIPLNPANLCFPIPPPPTF
jgi:hypothetical protein